MKIVIFNVGPALSAYIEMGSNKIVVDLGKGNDFSMVNDYLLPLFKKQVKSLSHIPIWIIFPI